MRCSFVVLIASAARPSNLHPAPSLASPPTPANAAGGSNTKTGRTAAWQRRFRTCTLLAVHRAATMAWMASSIRSASRTSRPTAVGVAHRFVRRQETRRQTRPESEQPTTAVVVAPSGVVGVVVFRKSSSNSGRPWGWRQRRHRVLRTTTPVYPPTAVTCTIRRPCERVPDSIITSIKR